ncbi:hypothetical protein T12_3557 [Trichinella patagoniensis]|uniref:Uncharacterized protein n=1 Tax=Trichinella patagoniensis TaxID=990121 RepID=A0A0V0ZFA4_9BILA|nr:hypothetical protein T12_3557 [Trichinella patagoniensis]
MRQKEAKKQSANRQWKQKMKISTGKIVRLKLWYWKKTKRKFGDNNPTLCAYTTTRDETEKIPNSR